MVAECAPGRAGLTRCYVSRKLCVLAGHRSDQASMLEMQRRCDLNTETNWVATKYVAIIKAVAWRGTNSFPQKATVERIIQNPHRRC